MEKPVFFPAVSPFSMQVAYVDIDSHSSLNQFEHHIHPECEIYLNLSGDVSFMVEDRIYPVTAGSVIITRPHEYHHCIYHSDKRHRHYWILFSSENNEQWLKLFFDRPLGENNLLRIVPSKLNRLVAILEKLRTGENSETARYRYFFELLDILNNGADTVKNAEENSDSDLRLAVRYINENILNPFTVNDLAKASGTTVSTLERHFRYSFGITPSEFVKQRRLGLAMELLKNGSSVTDACFNSGFFDCSKFISFFKKNVGMTPLQYKKNKFAP